MRRELVLFLAVVFSIPAHAANFSRVLNYFDNGQQPPQASSDNNEGYFGWATCRDNSFDHHPIGPSGATALPETCQPDTLYSWGNKHKMDELNKEAPQGGQWARLFSREIFTHINPAATFGYGPIAFRIKLKPGTKFFLYTKDALSTSDNSLCQQLGEEAEQNTVVVRTFSHQGLTGTEYILCSPNVMHSWSFETKQHHDEVVASLQFKFDHMNQDPNNWIPYTYFNHEARLFDTKLDGLDWSQKTMIRNLSTLQDKAGHNEGRITFSPEVKQDEAFHFSTDRPIFWHQ